MKGDPEVVRVLNLTLTTQLTAINQLFVHARMLRNWGLESLGGSEYEYSIKAMKQADSLIERVLFLEGLPNLQNLHKLLLGETVPEMLKGDLTLESQARAELVDGVALCESVRDYVTRDLLEDILEPTEEHIDWLESQLWLIDHAGLENYLQSGV